MVRMNPGNFIDLAGKPVGCLTVLSYAGNSRWLCRCECGAELEVRSQALRGQTSYGGQKACAACAAVNRRTTFELRQKYPGEYQVWIGLRRRCRDISRDDAMHYSLRGIAVCGRWESFANFIADMGARPGQGYSIERKENDEGYSPSNCRWATTPEQNRNRTDTAHTVLAGRKMCCSELARLCGVHKGSVRKLMLKGMTGDEIFTYYQSGTSRKGRPNR